VLNLIIDHCDKTISIKIVYFGPACSGKTASIKSLFSHFGKREKIESIESTVHRTLFFDYGTIEFQNTEWKLKTHIYTTTGQDFYLITRPITLRAVDGIIFVVDCQESVFDRNVLAWEELSSYFRENIKNIPLLIAFNKQDLPNKFSTDRFLEKIGYRNFENIEIRKTIAINGEGIFDCFEDILNRVISKYSQAKIKPSGK